MIARVGEIIMNFEIMGQGASTTLVSGMASDISSWSMQVPSFSLNFMTVCLDNRGTGKTDAPDHPYSIEMMAEDTAKLLDIIGIEGSNLVGFGMGGRIAVEMAIKHPMKVKSLVVCSTAPKATPFEKDLLLLMKSSIKNGIGRIELAKNEVNWTHSPCFFEDERVAEAIARVRMFNMSGTTDQSLMRQIEAVLDYDVESRLGQVKCPTLVIAGSRDRLIPPEFQRRMADAIPRASFLTLDAAHMVLTEAAKDFNINALGFLIENSA
jgi:3-oxoadipate enol-lactonase